MATTPVDSGGTQRAPSPISPRPTPSSSGPQSQSERTLESAPGGMPLAAHSPAGLPDRCAADPTHPPAQSAHRAGTSPARFPIPRPWHRARPTCARRHVRSTFNLSTCRCASFCTWATGPVHGSIGWACFLGRQPFVGEMTLKSVRQPRMRHHGKAAQPMVRRGHGLPAGGPGAPRALP